MHISKLKLYNFKGFEGHHVINFDSGMNFFVGDNNCGKSSIFEAIDFIRSRKEASEIITKTKLESDDYVSVEIELTGDMAFLDGNDNLKKYKPFVIDANGQQILRVMRSSQENEILQNKKSKTLNFKSVRVYNPESGQFENPTGIDNTITALFDAQFVWADTDSNDVSDLSKTKISGKIINAVTEDFVNSSTWQTFKKSHKETFGDGENSLAQTLKPIETEIRRILSEQYGETEVRFKFSLPDIESFFKTGSITLSEDGIETTSLEKGTGMQRALALALIQVYAGISLSEKGEGEKPILFFIDEPETFLHPQAQNKLLNALDKISGKSQIFIITHSPYLLHKYEKNTHSMSVFSKENGLNKIQDGHQFDLFGQYSPSWGEINYYAFGVVSVEFHNELYGFIQARAMQENECYSTLRNFDDYLVSKNDQILKNIDYMHQGASESYLVTLPTKIRNIIHHPENDNYDECNEEELEMSIKLLIDVLKSS